MKKWLITSGIIVIYACTSYGQDSTIQTNRWRTYASDTSITYRQIVILCDSLFALAGYPDSTGIASDSSDTVASIDATETPYTDYVRWKTFWAFRTDVTTGKLHDFGADASAKMSSSSGATYNCAGTSALQSSLPALPPYIRGWQFIGPQNTYRNPDKVDGTDAGCGGVHWNSLDQHLGQVNEIIVNPDNPDQIYATDIWGGLWYTTNATLAPNNTWTCLSDNLASIAGIGVSNLFVDFSSTSHTLLCLVGVPASIAIQNPRKTIGIFYSPDNGATFTQLDISSGYTTADGPILDMKYWPGSTSTLKLLFITTQFKIIRLNITDPIHISSGIIKDMTDPYHGPWLQTTENQMNRFHGFMELSFLPSWPYNMYVATKSNVEYGLPVTSGIYRINNCHYCNNCTLNPLNITTATDYLGGSGSFIYSPGPFLYSSGWNYSSTDQNMQCIPTTTPASVEVPVIGSYLENMTYTISFKLVLPPHTRADVVLKDVKENNTYIPDWGTGTTPTPGEISGDYYIGPGYSYSVATTQGKYINDGPTTYTCTVTTTVTATHFVDRLEFVAYALSGYSGTGYITLDDVSVIVPFQNFLYNLVTSPALPDNILCITRNTNLNKLTNISDGSSFSVSSYDMPFYVSSSSVDVAALIKPSPTDGYIVYTYSNSSSVGPMVWKINMNTGVTTQDCSEAGALHVDARCLVPMRNTSGLFDDLYIGNDGGIARGTFNGTWTSLNGTGMKTILGFDIGSSIHTGEVGIAATDNGIIVSNAKDFSRWQYNFVNDGGQVKYGKRYTTSNSRFEGYSYASGFAMLQRTQINTVPVITASSLVRLSDYCSLTVGVPNLGKMVTTYNSEYIGTGVCGNNIYNVKSFLSGTGTTASPFILRYNNLTMGASFTTPDITHYTNGREPVQAIAPDLYDPNYVAAYMHDQSRDPQGYFAYSTNANSVTPTWTVVSNNPAWNTATNATTNWQGLINLVADPRPHYSGSFVNQKRLWGGAAGYFTAGTDRVFETRNGGGTWNDLSIGLPSGPVNALAYDEQSHYLFAGTDQGVYAFNVDNGPISASNPWQCYSLNLPNSFVTGLDINRCTGKLYVSTYGRGAYEAELPPDYNWNGSLMSGGSYGSSGIEDFCDIDKITGTNTAPTFWTQDRDEVRTVYIGTGKALVIQNCTINMGRNKNIIVDVGGSLIIDGATITNLCGAMWGTISVLGDPTADQDLSHASDPITSTSAPYCNQGFLKIQTYTGTPNRDPVIENSYLGIFMAGQYYDGSDICDYSPGTEGGLLFADRTTFHNCASGAFFLPYNKTTYSYMSDCHFIADAPLQNKYFIDHATGIPRPYGMSIGVYVNGNSGISFWNDTFETVNNTTIGFSPDMDLRGNGYIGYNSYASINSCTFNNLTRGVLHTATWGPPVQVFDGKFNGCWRSISNDGGWGFICHKNQIINGIEPLFFPSTFTGTTHPMGINGNTLDFHISENTVTQSTAGGDFGIIATGNTANTLYRNTINNCTYGINGIFGIYDLFQLRCNTLNSSMIPIRIFSAGTYTPEAQGNCIDPTGNRFYFSSGTSPVQIQNLISSTTLNYSTYSNDPYKLYTSAILNVNPIPCSIECADFNECCPEKPFGFYKVRTSGGNGISLDDAISGLSLVDQQIANLQMRLNSGHASTLLAAINNLSLSSSAVTNTLLMAGPYLGDDVLKAAIDRSTPLNYADIKSIVLNNSALSQPVANELAIVDTQLSSDTDIITAQNTTSVRRLVQDSLQTYSTQQSEYISALTIYYDSVRDMQSVAQLYATHRLFESAFGYYLRLNDLSHAQNMIDSIQDTLLSHLMTIHLQHVTSGKSPDSLSSSDSLTIATLAQNRSTHVGEVAYIWYRHAYNLPFFEYFPYDSLNDSVAERKSKINSKNANNNIADKPNISIYPNPAKDNVMVVINNGNFGPGSYITATDIYGRKVFSTQEATSNKLNVNTQSWISGVYVFTVHLNDGTYYTSKVVIKKE